MVTATETVVNQVGVPAILVWVMPLSLAAILPTAVLPLTKSAGGRKPVAITLTMVPAPPISLLAQAAWVVGLAEPSAHLRALVR